VKYRKDDWALYCAFPEVKSLKNDKVRAVILDVLPKDDLYDYRIFLDDGSGRTKNVKESHLEPLNENA